MNAPRIAVETEGVLDDAPAQPERVEATKHFNATERNGAWLNCLACEREIPENAWFARIKLGERRVVFCRPRCVELFLDDPERFAGRIAPVGSAFAGQNARRFEHRLPEQRAAVSGF